MKPLARTNLVYRILAFSVVFALLWSASGFSASAEDAQYTAPAQRQNDIYAQCLNSGQARTTLEAETGTLRFVGTPHGRPIPQPTALSAKASPEAAARGYLSVCGSLFGLQDQASELAVIKQKADGERTTVRFQQEYQGIPVVGGEMILQMDGGNNIVSVSKEILPEVNVSTIAAVSAAQAEENALHAVAKKYQLSVFDLTATEPELWVYNPQLIGPEEGDTRLVWRMEVEPVALMPIREFVLVDAQRGDLVLSFNQVDMAEDRQTYTANNTTTLPGTLVCNEANPTCSGGDTDAQNAHIYAGDTYDFYYNYHGRDSIDNAGMTMVSTVHYDVGYAGSFWDDIRKQVVFGDGYAVDDIVAHEWTHGVTENESGLFNYYQSGAINESFSDLWGEFVDQTNGKGTDTEAVKWLLGEDSSEGAMRDMEDPTTYGDPDKMTSTYYDLSADDNGGVHTNSGVNNKAVFLMTDGGTFNSKTVTALGMTKVATIYYEAQTNLLTSGADYKDLYDALYQACYNKTGVNGITTDDCQEVRDATDAVQMNQQPLGGGYNPEADLCINPSQAPFNLFYDDMEYGTANWSFGALAGSNRWARGSSFAHSGTYSLYANDSPAGVNTDTYAAMNTSITLPANSFLHFHHAYGFEDNGVYTYDGGILEYSLNNGATWLDASSLFYDNGYNGEIETGHGNPLAGRDAFVADSHGYISSRLYLNSLTGQSIRFRWRMGLDDTTYDWGWWLDDVRIYTCGNPSAAPGTITDLVAETGTTDGTVNLTWTAPDDDVAVTNYLVRYSTSPITGEGSWWNNASPFPNTMVPQAAGETENLTVTGLMPGVTYYFAVRARDADYFLGDLSNEASAIVPGAPVAPPAASLVSPSGNIGSTDNPPYTWNKVSTATWYYLWVNNSSGTAVIKKWYDASSVCSDTTCSVTPDPILSIGNYTWWVQTWNSAGYGPWSSGLTFNVTSLIAPGTAMLLSPSGNIGMNYTPTYTWSKVTEAEGQPESAATWYYLWVNGPSGNVFKQWYSVSSICVGSTCSVTPSTTLSGGDHIWWVQTWNSAGYGPWSSGMSFNVETLTPPGATTLESPSGSITDTTPDYTWGKVSTATWYYLWVNNSSGTAVIKQWYNASSVCGDLTCSVTPTTALSGGNYKWWVQTWNSAGYGPWSSDMSFSLSPPTATTLESPSGSITDTTPDYTWGKVSTATWYYLWVNNSSGTAVIKKWYDASVVCGDSTCLVTPDTSLSNGNYTWWVQTWNSVGYGPWSSGLSFDVTSP
ncbi:MAG: M4 family metallopeptidase [Chloroflexota bacterium]